MDENSTVKCPPFHFKKITVDYFSFLQFLYIQYKKRLVKLEKAPDPCNNHKEKAKKHQESAELNPDSRAFSHFNILDSLNYKT